MKNVKNTFLILLFIIPFARGLYFYHELFIVIGIILLLFSITITKNRFVKIPWDFNTFIYLGIVLLYMISIIFSIDKGMAFIGFLKIFAYFCFYLLYVQFYTEEFKERAVDVLIYSGLLGVVISIIGYILQNVIYTGLIQNNRLGGIFQYANTYAIYCLVTFVLLSRKEIKTKVDYIGLIALIIAIILTFSRTTYLLAVFSVAIIFLLNKKNQGRLLFISTIGIILSRVIITLFGESSVGKRVVETSLQASELQTRFLYYSDGLRMIKEFPLGLGHLGYYYIQRTYQTGSTYFVKYIHNSVLQITLDIGILGGLLLILYFVFNIKRDSNWYYRLALIVLFSHSLLDFDFEFPIIIFIIIIINGVNTDKFIYYEKIRIVEVLASISWIVYIYFSVVTCFNYFGHHHKALELYSYYTDAGVSIIRQEKNYTDKTLNISNAIIHNNKYCVEAFAYNRDYYYNKGEIIKANDYAIRVMKLNKLNIKHLEEYSNILLEYSKEYINNKRYEQAKKFLWTIIDMPYYLEKLEISHTTKLNVKHKPYFKMTNRLLINYENALNLLEEILVIKH